MITRTQVGSHLKRSEYISEDDTLGSGYSEPNEFQSSAPTNIPIILSNIVRIAYGFLGIMMGIRVFLSLFAADTTNSFAAFVYSFTRPFVAPFQGLFGVDTLAANGSRFEIETLLGIVVYGLAAWIIISLLLITKKHPAI